MVTFADHFYSKYYYGRRATLSIDDVLPLHGTLEGAVVCNVKHHVGGSGAFSKASRDYAIMISHNPDNGAWMRGAPRRRKATMANGCL